MTTPEEQLKIDQNLDLKHLLTQVTWSPEELSGVEKTHRNPVDFIDKAAYWAVQIARTGFDVVTMYKLKISSGRMTEKDWSRRIIFLETVAGVPGMVGGAVRHLHSLRLMRRDHGWIHSLLAEAENERMHLLIALSLRQPGLIFRGCVIVGQAVFFSVYSLAYILCPRFCHRFVGYLEEEAVHTYTNLLAEIDAGNLPKWKDMKAPRMARVYYNLPVGSKLRDVFECIRCDESAHRDSNHNFGDLRSDEPNTQIEHLRKGHFQNQNVMSGVVDVVSRMKSQTVLEEFQKMDISKTGYLTEDDIRQAMKKKGVELSDQDMHDLFEAVDTNKDGQISFDEFVKGWAWV